MKPRTRFSYIELHSLVSDFFVTERIRIQTTSKVSFEDEFKGHFV